MYDDEQETWDDVHGGKFTFEGEHKAVDRDLVENEKHAEMHKAFEKSGEEYHAHSLMKPTFDDFKLRFVGTHDQVEDKIPD